MNFRSFSALADRPRTRAFEAGLLPDSEKERLCRSLLAEFGVTRVRTHDPKGELIHCCALPWHDERHPSASLNYKKLTYRCLGCDSGGGLLWFIGSCRGETGVEARQWLDDQTGTGADEQTLSALLDFFDAVYAPRQGVDLSPIPRMAQRILEPWMLIHPYLTDPAPDGRNIPEANIMAFQVGYAPDYPVHVDAERRVTSHRIVIPHFWRDALVGWQTRRIINDGTAKYLSSPDFPKDKTIFNYRPDTLAVVVESPMSVIAMADRCPDMEATFGASITDKQVRLLAEHRRVILWFDNDAAGWKATDVVAEVLSAYTDVRVVDNPWNADAADLVKYGMGAVAEALIADAVPYSVWQRPPTVTAVGEPDQIGAK